MYSIFSILQRLQLQLLLFDEDFRIPQKFPYSEEDHYEYLTELQNKDKDTFLTLRENFLQRAAQQMENITVDDKSLPASSSTYKETPNVVQSHCSNIYSTPKPKNVASSSILTNRPELAEQCNSEISWQNHFHKKKVSYSGI